MTARPADRAAVAEKSVGQATFDLTGAPVASGADRRQTHEAPALTQCPAVFHCVEQSVVETLHGVAAARRRGMDRIGKGADGEPGGKSHRFPQ